MASSFKSLNLFGSGPHRFIVSKQGELFLPAYLSGGSGGGSVLLGPLELEVVITGRLVATSESVLWTLRDAITAQLAHPPVPGTLIDLNARSWAGMSFLTFTPVDRVDRGRVKSLGYKAVFRRIA